MRKWNVDKDPDRLRQYRQENNLTQEDIARFLHLSFQTVNGWEKKKHIPHAFMANAIWDLTEGRTVINVDA